MCGRWLYGNRVWKEHQWDEQGVEINSRWTRKIEYISMYESEDFVAKRKELEQIIIKYQPQDDDALAIGNKVSNTSLNKRVRICGSRRAAITSVDIWA